ncbi:MAG TPA: flagellin [Alphaproteobacteria bacterium]|nr:flagellin [Alphaproteobacteria bacterium]
MTSINTNVGAQVALADLSSTQYSLNVTQNRISTGLKVTGPQDDASDFSIAQGIRSDLKAFDAVQQSLSAGTGIVQTAIAGATSVSNLLNTIKSKAIEASNPANTATQQSILSNDFNAMIAQLNTFINNAVYNGRNLLSSNSVSVSVTSTISGGQLTLNNASTLSTISATLSSGVTTTSAALALLSTVDAQQLIVGSALGSLGANANDLNFLTTFTKSLSDSVNQGLGALVDANLAQESAQLQALQTKQQLGVQALSIANQRPQIILSLFR